MQYKQYQPCANQNHDALYRLFLEVFRQSENEEEGRQVAKLVQELIETTPSSEMAVFTAYDGEELCGGVVFSKLTNNADLNIVLLSPMAVKTNRQGCGVGQTLIRYAFDALKSKGVQVVVTYGDIAFYGKLGFVHIDNNTIASPLPLSYPEGWLGVSLVQDKLPCIDGKTQCVPAFNHQVYW